MTQPQAATGRTHADRDHAVLLSVLTLDLPDQIANIREVQRAYELVQQLIETRDPTSTEPMDRRKLASLMRILNVALAAEVEAAQALVGATRQ